MLSISQLIVLLSLFIAEMAYAMMMKISIIALAIAKTLFHMEEEVEDQEVLKAQIYSALKTGNAQHGLNALLSKARPEHALT